MTGADPDELPERHRRPRRRRRHHGAGAPLRRRGRRRGGRPPARTSTCSSSTRRLEWRGRADEQLRAVVTGAIQLVAVQERAAAAGIDPDDLLALVRPVPVENVELGMVAGRSPDDETAAFLMTRPVADGHPHLRESRADRRRGGEGQPSRRGAARPHAGPQPAGRQGRGHRAARLRPVRGDRRGGARRHGRGRRRRRPGRQRRRARLGRRVVRARLRAVRHGVRRAGLAGVADRGRPERRRARQLRAARRLLGLVHCRRRGPDSGWSQLVSLFPATAPFAMPGRIALGTAAWWEPLLAVALPWPPSPVSSCSPDGCTPAASSTPGRR